MHRNYSTHDRPKGSDCKKRHYFIVRAMRGGLAKLFLNKDLRQLPVAPGYRPFWVFGGKSR